LKRSHEEEYGIEEEGKAESAAEEGVEQAGNGKDKEKGSADSNYRVKRGPVKLQIPAFLR
jgi:hypothetical protein